MSIGYITRFVGLILALSFLGPVHLAGAQDLPTASVNVGEMAIYESPSENSAVIAVLVRDEEMWLSGWRTYDARWIQVILPDGYIGWAEAWKLKSAFYLENLKVMEMEYPDTFPEEFITDPQGAETTARRLYFRKGPGEVHPVIKSLPYGTWVLMYGRTDDGFWVNVRLTTGETGWVFSRYLDTNSPIVNLPITADTTPDPVDYTPAVTGQGGYTPPATGGPSTHVVQTGDTLYGIAQAYGVNPDTLASYNNIANPNYIYIGQVLYLP